MERTDSHIEMVRNTEPGQKAPPLRFNLFAINLGLFKQITSDSRKKRSIFSPKSQEKTNSKIVIYLEENNLMGNLEIL